MGHAFELTPIQGKCERDECMYCGEGETDTDEYTTFYCRQCREGRTERSTQLRISLDNQSSAAPIQADNWMGDRTIQASAPNSVVQGHQ